MNEYQNSGRSEEKNNSSMKLETIKKNLLYDALSFNLKEEKFRSMKRQEDRFNER